MIKQTQKINRCLNTQKTHTIYDYVWPTMHMSITIDWFLNI